MEADTDTQLKSDGHVDSRDFRIQNITLIGSTNESIDITQLVAEIQVRQDLYLSFMSGEMLITDGIGLHSEFGLHGGEYIYLHIAVPQQEIKIKKAFRVYKIGDRHMIDSYQRYTIFFMSDELFGSYSKKVNKAYKNTKISDIVSDILKTTLKISDKKISIEETSNLVSVVIPNWRPFEAISWLSSRAYNSSGLDTYFFFEDTEGFHFKSIQSMFKSNPVNGVPFIFENKRSERRLDLDKFSIDELKFKKDFDILSTISSGGYTTKLRIIDPITRKFTNVNNISCKDLNTLYDNPVMSSSNELLSNFDTYQITYLPADGIENWIKRNMHLNLLNGFMLDLSVPGNMDLQVGGVVDISIPLTIPPKDGDMMDKRKSGLYLIVGVNHKFDLITHKFTSLMIVTRDSSSVALPLPDNKIHDKIRQLNE